MPRLAGLVLLGSLVAAGAAWGSWIAISMEELARDSDAIVEGRLTNMRIVGSEKGPYESNFTLLRGTIHVDRVLWSRRPAARELVIAWSSWNGSPNIDHREIAEKSVLWLLKRDERAGRELVYRADYPTRRIVLEDPDEVENARRELAQVARPGPRVRSMKRLIDQTAATLERRAKAR